MFAVDASFKLGTVSSLEVLAFEGGFKLVPNDACISNASVSSKCKSVADKVVCQVVLS